MDWKDSLIPNFDPHSYSSRHESVGETKEERGGDIYWKTHVKTTGKINLYPLRRLVGDVQHQLEKEGSSLSYGNYQAISQKLSAHLSQMKSNVRGVRISEVDEREMKEIHHLIDGISLIISKLVKKDKLKHGLEGSLTIIGILGGIFFLSPTLTGNVIGNLNQTTSKWIGGVLLIMGLIAALIYFRRK